MSNRTVVLNSHPKGMPVSGDFDLIDAPVPETGDGELLIRALYLSVDPYMRGRMNPPNAASSKHYAEAFELGKPLNGGLVGTVLESRDDAFSVGDVVLYHGPWSEYVGVEPRSVRKITGNERIPVSAYLGVLGMPGRTAYAGIKVIGKVKPGDTVYVSAAAGAVGAAACQIAKNLGCKVIGSAGSDEKVIWLLEEAGVDFAFNYKTVDSLALELAKCGEIDMYFDNVGGATLEAALSNMAFGGRIALCGMISGYNRMTKGVRNLFLAITRRLVLQGFIVSDLESDIADFEPTMSEWIASGKLKWRETVAEGIESVPQAFIDLLEGNKLGKMIVRISPDHM